MIDSKQLVEYAKHPELAFQNLSKMLDLLQSTDETEANSASEWLENCGAPRSEDVAFFLDQLKSAQSPRVYWCSTLLGRLGANGAGLAKRSPIQAELCNAISNETLELSARERAAWAIGELGGFDSDCRAMLKKQVENAPARLKRLLEAALAI